MKTAVITVAHGRHDHLRRQHEMLWRSTVQPDLYLVVAVDDPGLNTWRTCSPEARVIPFAGGHAGLPMADARNAGAAEAIRSGAELLVFLDVDCLADEEMIQWYQRAAEHDEHGGSLLCGPVAYLPPPPADGYALDRLSTHPFHRARPAPSAGALWSDGEHKLFWSLSFAVTREVWERVGGFCSEYRGYGAEDTDFAQAAKAAGVELTWVGGAAAYHQWHPTSSPPVQHVDDILRNGAIFARRWGWWPMEGWLAQFVELGLVEVDESGAGYRRVGDGPSTGSGDVLSSPSTGSGNGGPEKLMGLAPAGAER
ncbi:MAG: galactosyltransferase-related protein [Propionibacteriaceae bacterium]